MHSIKLLENFIKKHPSGKELKRALAVKLSWENHPYRDIQKILEVSLGLIRKWKRYFHTDGWEGCSPMIEEVEVIWRRSADCEIVSGMFTQECLNLKELEVHIAKFYKVVFSLPTKWLRFTKRSREELA